MSYRILFVDDDANILDAFRRNLRKRFEVDTALGPVAALKLVAQEEYAVVVSDLKMPDMGGVEFLAEVHKLSPDTVRVMLTGHADLDASIAAVNEGRVFRFLTKPCPAEIMEKTLTTAMEQHRLVTAEKALLRDTVRGSIAMLSDVLSNLRPEIYGRSARISPMARRLGKLLNDPRPWETETAAMLCQLGFIFLPEAIVKRAAAGKQLSVEEYQTYVTHVELAAELVSNIPRMEDIAHVIRYQEKAYDGSGYPFDEIKEQSIPLGARILKVLLEFDRLMGRNMTSKEALAQMQKLGRHYDAGVLAGLEHLLGDEGKYNVKMVPIGSLSEGMFLMSDIMIEHGGNRLKALGKGQEVTPGMLHRLKRLAEIVTITQEVKVIPKGNETPK